MSDVIKRFRNEVVLAGKLAELDTPRYGEDKNGRSYLSIKGVIQCGDTPIYNRKFESYISATKKDGTDSKLYETMHNWVETAVPMTKDKENCTMVELSGGILDAAYINKEEALKEGYRFSVQFVNPFTNYRCEVNLEGYVKTVTPEIINEKETGRLKVEMISMDNFRNVINLKNIIVPKEMAEGFNDSGYENGNVIGTLYMNFTPNEKKSETPKGGFGQQRTDGKSYLELTLTGGEIAMDLAEEDDEENPDVVSKGMVKRMLASRTNAIEEIKAKGYQGKDNSASKKGFGSTNKKATNSGKSSKAETVEEDDDDDMPF